MTALKPGNVVITAISVDGSKTAKCKVTVLESVVMYRLYNPNSGEHFYTGSQSEIKTIVAAGWKHLGGFAGTVLNAHDIAKETEKNIRRALAASEYETEGVKAYQVRAPKAEGFRYTYTVQGTAMTAETCIVKTGRDLYELHFYSRTETLDECLPVWEELLASLRWQN